MAVERVRFLDSGSLVIDRSHVMWNIDCGNPVRFPVYSVLIEHTRRAASSSTRATTWRRSRSSWPSSCPSRPTEQTIPAQLEKCGFAPADVTAVINSHLHFDHCGGQRHLPDAVTWVAKEDLRHCLVPEPFERLGYADKVFHRPDSVYRWLEGERVRVRRRDPAPATRPGHTVGHYSLLLERDGARADAVPAPTSPTRARPGRRS